MNYPLICSVTNKEAEAFFNEEKQERGEGASTAASVIDDPLSIELIPQCSN